MAFSRGSAQGGGGSVGTVGHEQMTYGRTVTPGLGTIPETGRSSSLLSGGYYRASPVYSVGTDPADQANGLGSTTAASTVGPRPTTDRRTSPPANTPSIAIPEAKASLGGGGVPTTTTTVYVGSAPVGATRVPTEWTPDWTPDWSPTSFESAVSTSVPGNGVSGGAGGSDIAGGASYSGFVWSQSPAEPLASPPSGMGSTSPLAAQQTQSVVVVLGKTEDEDKAERERIQERLQVCGEDDG